MTLWTVACQAPLSWDSPGKNPEVGCRALLQGVFLTQGSNSVLLYVLHWQVYYFTTNATWEAQEKAHHAQKTSRNWWGWSPMSLMSIIGKEVKEKIGSQWSGRQAWQLPVSQATPGSSSFPLTLVLLVFYQIFLGHHLMIILVLLTLPGLLSSFSFSIFLAN